MDWWWERDSGGCSGADRCVSFDVLIFFDLLLVCGVWCCVVLLRVASVVVVIVLDC